jgi:hypothetical protein
LDFSDGPDTGRGRLSPAEDEYELSVLGSRRGRRLAGVSRNVGRLLEPSPLDSVSLRYFKLERGLYEMNCEIPMMMREIMSNGM